MSDMQRLYDADPLTLTTADIDLIIESYRAARGNFELGDKKAGGTKAIKKDKPPSDPNAPKLKTLDLSALLKKV